VELARNLGGRFPRAAIEPSRASHCGVSTRISLPQESSA